MRTLGTIRTFKTNNFTVTVTAVEEYDLDLSWDDGSTREGLENGTLIAYCAKAAVYYRGHEIATDYLGNCIYKSLNDFMDHKECGKQNKERTAKGEPGRCGSYFRSMITAVCRDARKEIETLQSVRVRTRKG